MWLFMKGYLHPGVLKDFFINNNEITVSSNSEDFILVPGSIEMQTLAFLFVLLFLLLLLKEEEENNSKCYASKKLT